jgi:hypothetical protein
MVKKTLHPRRDCSIRKDKYGDCNNNHDATSENYAETLDGCNEYGVGFDRSQKREHVHLIDA